jgi:hypothetical protein
VRGACVVAEGGNIGLRDGAHRTHIGGRPKAGVGGAASHQDLVLCLQTPATPAGSAACALPFLEYTSTLDVRGRLDNQLEEQMHVI